MLTYAAYVYSVHASDRQLRKLADCAKCAATKPRNIQFAKAGRTEMLAAGKFGDWHTAVGEVPWSSIPKTPMNIQTEMSQIRHFCNNYNVYHCCNRAVTSAQTACSATTSTSD